MSRSPLPSLPGRPLRLPGWLLASGMALAALLLGGVSGCGRADPRYLQALQRLQSGEALQEVARLEQAVREDPLSAKTRVRLGKAYLQQGRLPEAAEAFRGALALDENNVEALLALSILASRSPAGATQAVALAQRAVRLDPKNTEPWNQLALALLQVGQPQAAENALRQALELRPKDMGLLLNAARVAAGIGRQAQAESYCRRAAAADPASSAPGLTLGNLQLAQGQTRQALATFQALARRFPDDALVQEAIGRAYASQQRWEEALQAFLTAKRLQPAWSVPSIQAGRIYLRLKDNENAAREFELAVARSVRPVEAPYYLEAKLGLAEALEGQGKLEEARLAYEQILQRYPDHADAAHRLIQLYARSRQRLQRAVAMAEQLALRYPDSGEIQDTAGWVYYLAGRIPKAIDHLQQAARMLPTHGTVHYHLGKALLAAGREEEGIQALEKALSLPLPADLQDDARRSMLLD